MRRDDEHDVSFARCPSAKPCFESNHYFCAYPLAGRPPSIALIGPSRLLLPQDYPSVSVTSIVSNSRFCPVRFVAPTDSATRSPVAIKQNKGKTLPYSLFQRTLLGKTIGIGIGTTIVTARVPVFAFLCWKHSVRRDSVPTPPGFSSGILSTVSSARWGETK